MNKLFKNATSGILAVSTALSLTGMGLVGTAHALPLTQPNATLSSVESLASSTHTVAFKVAATTTVKAVGLKYQIKPSGTSIAAPTGLVTTASTLAVAGTVTVKGAATTGWTSASASNGTVLISSPTGATALSGTDPIVVSLSGITNNNSTTSGVGECDAIANSDTCYILITTYSDEAGTLPIDTGVASYTVITPTTVTATVDPSLTFTVAGVANLAAINVNDPNAACTGADVTSTGTAIPFGNIQVNSAKCGQQALTVSTNAQLGYKVYHKFIGTTPSADMMTGTNSANNFDPFTAPWGTPAAFTGPTGAANVNSGFVGARVVTPTSNGVAGFGTSNFYAAPAVSTTAIGNTVMDNGGPDNGGTPTYVTFKIQAGASQPADSYSGKMVYNVVATY